MSLQYIRAVAALLVVLWHTGWTRSVLGQSGVDLFFVVSGFVMMLVSRRERSPIRFGVARLMRIVPLYWAVTLVAACVVQSSRTKIASSLLFWPTNLFPVVIQGWSLNLEMTYYAMFAIALLWSRRWRVPILALQLILVCIVLPALFSASKPLQIWSNPLAFEFLTGAGLYAVWMRGAVPIGWKAWLVVMAGCAVLAATHFLGGAPEGWLRVVAWGMPALAIVMGSLGIERSGQLPRVPLLGRLGEASYSIYLTHILVLSLVGGLLRHLWAPFAVLLAIPLTCAVGWAVYLGFEQPILKLSKRLLRPRWASQAVVS